MVGTDPIAGDRTVLDDVPGDVVTAVGHFARLPLVGVLDGGVSRRLIHRCRTAASILLAVGTTLLLIVALAPWGVISAVLAMAAGTALVGSLLLLRRAGLWSKVADSLLPAAAPESASAFRTREPAPFFVPDTSARSDEPAQPGAVATIGPPRQLSPGVPSAPVKRRLNTAVVPIYADDGPSPGDGALVIHARADGKILTEGDTVLVWFARNTGLTSLPAKIDVGRRPSSVRGRFVLFREADAEVFLATTRLTDTW